MASPVSGAFADIQVIQIPYRPALSTASLTPRLAVQPQDAEGRHNHLARSSLNALIFLECLGISPKDQFIRQ